ncbi:MAG TPA: hypothetical protein PLY66_05955 [Acidobacteriota bacterium]|nr:hypothetical protein [Acidobacteriota bacterium]HQF87522.1 hypothetical protein [Acidobacteriota bacterium]HQG92714.1 hypothetical protein [Acidobacteriota bacterium]HQK86367.1 hypothetical protein [Acidobacteriota bacterium]
MADELPADPAQTASDDDIEEARRHWEGLHDDECYRDVHGVPTLSAQGERGCMILLAVVAGGIIMLVALSVWLVVHILF